MYSKEEEAQSTSIITALKLHSVFDRRALVMTTVLQKNIVQRARLLQNHLKSNISSRSFAITTSTMAKLDINTKIRMNSGHDIPMLGYGKSDRKDVLSFVLFASFVYPTLCSTVQDSSLNSGMSISCL